MIGELILLARTIKEFIAGYIRVPHLDFGPIFRWRVSFDKARWHGVEYWHRY